MMHLNMKGNRVMLTFFMQGVITTWASESRCNTSVSGEHPEQVLIRKTGEQTQPHQEL